MLVGTCRLDVALQYIIPSGDDNVHFYSTPLDVPEVGRRWGSLCCLWQCTGACQRAQCMGSEKAGGKKPQRAVVLLPGLGNNSQDYEAVAQALQAHGLHVQTAAVARADWYFSHCPPRL